MKGTHTIVVSNTAVKYEFEVRRNITVIKGDSATGKTTLVELISEFYESGEDSGISISCDKECRSVAGRDWKLLINNIKDSIIFIDEDNEFLPTIEFADTVKNSDNYYVIVSREGLQNLPYSVEEIYGIKSSGKYSGLKQEYHELYHIYGSFDPKNDIKPEVVIVEDSNSGFDFFKNVSEGKDFIVVSASGKSNIFKEITKYKDKKLLIIADGAAFGSEIDRIMKLIKKDDNIALFLPESFEWLILSSGIIKNNINLDVLDTPSDYIESSDFFSWERFFTHYLIEITKGTYLKYNKKQINPVYLHDNNKKSVLNIMKKIKME